MQILHEVALRLGRGDVVFLYQSGEGIVAIGEASGKLEKCPYHENPEHVDEEYFMKLRHFQRVSPAVPAAEIKEVTGSNCVFRSTMFPMNAESGKVLREYIVTNNFKTG